MIVAQNEQEMQDFGRRLGELLRGGEIIELVGDVGAGKTTLVRGIARGMGITETIQSPSFTINRFYDSDKGCHLAHYDFYRLAEPGLMADELAETLAAKDVVTIIEWAESVEDILPADRLLVRITPSGETAREVVVTGKGELSERLKGGLV